MSRSSREVETLRALVRSSTRFANDEQRDAVAEELTEFMNCARLSPLRRRRLLQFLHTSRALETALRSTCQALALTIPPRPGMGTYLTLLGNCSPAALPQAVRDNCRTRVADVRNRLAHGAGAYPTGDHQLNSGFAAARSCLALLLA